MARENGRQISGDGQYRFTFFLAAALLASSE
jgi:hypothetical protein